MAVERVVLLLALASLLAVHAADVKPAGSFVDWLARQSSTKAHTAQAEEVETASPCLQLARLGSCKCLHSDNGKCLRAFSELKLSCCSDSAGDKYHTAYEELLVQKHTVGTGSITEDLFETPVHYGESETTKIGLFEATIELKADSSKCGAPLTDGMTLTITGEILHYPKVAFMSSLADLVAEQSCSAQTGLSVISKRAKSVKGAAAAVATAAKGDDASTDVTAFYTGPGNIYVGTYWLTSRNRAVSYKTGQLQLVVATDVPATYARESSPPEKSFVAKDAAVSLDFYLADEASSS